MVLLRLLLKAPAMTDSESHAHGHEHVSICSVQADCLVDAPWNEVVIAHLALDEFP